MMVDRFRVCDLKTFLFFSFLFLVFVGISLLASPARAVVISSGDGLGNTTAAIDDFGFANVGVCGGGSAVYLGYGWVITAAHMQMGDVSFNDQSYGYNPDSISYLTNPSELGLSGSPDLKLFQLTQYSPSARFGDCHRKRAVWFTGFDGRWRSRSDR